MVEVNSKTVERQGDFWPIDGFLYRDNNDYTVSFKKILKKLGIISFEHLVYMRGLEGKKINFLDIMGNGLLHFEQNNQPDFSVGLRLVNMDETYFKQLLKPEHKLFAQQLCMQRELVIGDFYNFNTFSSVEQLFKEKPLNLIVCRPMGPFAFTFEDYFL
jgi:hypothetical protein